MLSKNASLKVSQCLKWDLIGKFDDKKIFRYYSVRIGMAWWNWIKSKSH